MCVHMSVCKCVCMYVCVSSSQRTSLSDSRSPSHREDTENISQDNWSPLDGHSAFKPHLSLQHLSKRLPKGTPVSSSASGMQGYLLAGSLSVSSVLTKRHWLSWVPNTGCLQNIFLKMLEQMAESKSGLWRDHCHSPGFLTWLVINLLPLGVTPGAFYFLQFLQFHRNL